MVDAKRPRRTWGTRPWGVIHLVVGWAFDVVDDYAFDWGFGGDEFEAELLFDGGLDDGESVLLGLF
jgi:hypothetical protein